MPRGLRDVLKDRLSDGELKQIRAFDIIGDIAVIKLPEELSSKKQLVGQALMQVHRNIKTVLLQTGPVGGEFRVRGLEVIAGECRTETVHKESGCVFKTDLSKVYFSPRLAYERFRIASLVKPGETVTNLFAGVGCYSIVIAKHSRAAKIYSIDKNPSAFEYMCENVRINKVGDRVIPILGDAREIVEKELAGKADRVLMPLPESAREFLDTAILGLKSKGGVVHFYDFGEEPEPFKNSFEFVGCMATAKGKKVELLNGRLVRSYAPKVYHIVLDLKFD